MSWILLQYGCRNDKLGARVQVDMHIKFERILLINHLSGRIPRYRSGRWEWWLKFTRIEQFVDAYRNYYGELPTGQHDLGSIGDTGIHVGVIDFDRARREIVGNHGEKLRGNETADQDSIINQLRWEMLI